MPNPFYQIYEGAALLAGAEPYFLDTTAASGYLPDLDAVPAERVAPLPGAVSVQSRQPDRRGAVAGVSAACAGARRALRLRRSPRDECYAEIYRDEARPAAGPAARPAAPPGARSFERCIVFHCSLQALERARAALRLRRRRPGDHQALPAVSHLSRQRHAGADAARQHRRLAGRRARRAPTARLYQEKFARVLPHPRAAAGGERAGRRVLPVAGRRRRRRALRARAVRAQNITVLPGSYLGRARARAAIPGAGRVRISLVPAVAQCVEAAERIREFLRTNAEHRADCTA